MLASVVESFPDSRVVYAAAQVIAKRLDKWVKEEPGQIEDICESLIRERLSDA